MSDYKINVFNIAWLSDKTTEMFQSDFKFIAKYFQTKRKNKKYVPTNEEIKHVDSLLKMFSTLTGDNHFEAIYNDRILSKKGGVTMCDIVQSFVNEGIERGIEEGIERGIEKGKAELIANLIESDAGSIEQIAAWVKLPVSEVKKLAEKVQAKA